MANCVYCGGNTFAEYQFHQVINPPCWAGSYDVLAVCASCEEEHVLPSVRLPGVAQYGPRESWNEPTCEICQAIPRFFVIAIFFGYAVLDEESEENPREFWADGMSMKEAKRQADELAAQLNHETEVEVTHAVSQSI